MALASAVLHRLFFWNSRSKAMQPPRLAEKPWAIQPTARFFQVFHAATLSVDGGPLTASPLS